MLRQTALALSLVLVASAAVASSVSLASLAPPETMEAMPLGQMTYRALEDPRFEERVRHYLAEHGLDHPRRLDLQGASPIDVARATLNENERAGRTVAEWVRLANAQALLALQADARAPASLADEVARLADIADAPYDAAQLAQVRAQADALPADVRAPFAALVAATADAYAAQTPVADEVVHRLALSNGALTYALTAEERETTLANALAIMAATNAFREAAQSVAFPTSADPLFADPLGLVYLGSAGNDVYERGGQYGDPILIVDPAGNDLYRTSAGGACADRQQMIHACNGLVASVVLDVLGDDEYEYDGVPTNAQASGSVGAIGLLVDAEGDDRYFANFVQATPPRPFWGGPLGYIDAGAQGFGLAGVGLLVDALGDDVYEADVTSSRYSVWGFSQGFGNVAGVGIAADGSGNDDWLAYGFDGGITGRSFSQGFQGLYPGGSGFFGGVGVFSETGYGSDEYHAWDNATTTDFYAYGFGAFGGTGIFYEDGGDDHYEAVESATNPWIAPLLNCAYGTASFAGLGAFLEMGGADHYFGDTRSPRLVATMNEGFGGPAEGEGIFLDVSGDDGHFMEAHMDDVLEPSMTHGRGLLFGGGEGAFGGNTVGIYLDLGGSDAYTGAAPSQNNAIWLAGMDFEAGSLPSILTP